MMGGSSPRLSLLLDGRGHQHMAASTDTLSILSERQKLVSGWNYTKLLHNEEDRIVKQWQVQCCHARVIMSVSVASWLV